MNAIYIYSESHGRDSDFIDINKSPEHSVGNPKEVKGRMNLCT